MSSPQKPDFIQIKNFSKHFREGGQKREVLRDASASFKRGEFVAIIGKSGTGKSTLLNLISGIDLVDGGEIHLNGQSLTALNEHQRTLFRRQNIGFIFQFFNLIPTLNVLENVRLPLKLTRGNGQEAQQKASALRRSGLETPSAPIITDYVTSPHLSYQN